jgi:3-oxoacyl-[acyl-carrier protein] reductase
MPLKMMRGPGPKELAVSEAKKVSLVTGGSRGIGREICLALAKPGDVIAFNHFDPDESAAEETVKMLEERGVIAEGKKFDVSDPAAAKEYVDHLVSEYGRVDNLINNAGITMDTLLVRMSLDQFERVMKVNLTGAFVCTQAVAKQMMRQRSGSIVNITSVAGQTGNAGQANYSSSKAGLIGLTKTSAKELAPRSVRVNAVAPGFIETEMTRNLPEKAVKAIMALIPMAKAGQPGEVASVVDFLCSNKASYMTGQVLHVNGGMYM